MHHSDLQPRKEIDPQPRARELHWTSCRESAEPLQDAAGSGPGRAPGWGRDPGSLQLHLEETWSEVTDVGVHVPFGSALHSGVTAEPPPDDALGRCTQPSSPQVCRPTQTKAVITHPASVVGRNLEKFSGAGGGECFGNGFISENFNFHQ